MDNLARAIELLPFIQVTRRQNPTTLVLGYSLSWKPELRKSAQISQGSAAARVLLGSIEVLGVRALRPPSSLRAGLLGGVSSASHCFAGRHRRTLGPVVGGQRWGPRLRQIVEHHQLCRCRCSATRRPLHGLAQVRRTTCLLREEEPQRGRGRSERATRRGPLRLRRSGTSRDREATTRLAPRSTIS